eukprot:1284069-Pleurochrysis_carterae.AAC.1
MAARGWPLYTLPFRSAFASHRKPDDFDDFDELWLYRDLSLSRASLHCVHTFTSHGDCGYLTSALDQQGIA